MKGNANVIAALNQLLSEELTALNQYFVHAEMDDDWGLHRLHDFTYSRAMSEMKHAEKLVERIMFLEGIPIVDKFEKINTGRDVRQQLTNDLALELKAVESYNRAIAQVCEANDNATADLIRNILKEEDADVQEIEKKLSLIKLMGLKKFLATQAKE